MNRHQGEDLAFQIKFKDGGAPGIASFDDVAEVVVYFYTPKSRIIKFTSIVKEGYTQLARIDNMNLSAAITGEQTKILHGPMTVEVLVRLNVGNTLRQIDQALTGINIIETAIKAES